MKYFYGTKLVYYDAHLNHNGKGGFRPLVRVGPKEVSMMTSEGVRIVWGGDFERSSWYEVFTNFGCVSILNLLMLNRSLFWIDNRVYNMFSYQSSKAHKERRRIFASAYSKTAVMQPSVQSLIKERTSKLLHYLDQQMSPAHADTGTSGPIVVRNVFRALQADVFTAFAFSESEGTTFLDNLRTGPNTMEDLGMGMMDLCHEDRRDAYFFWESERPFKHFPYFLGRSGPLAHKKAETWLSELARKYESRACTISTTEPVECKLQRHDQSPYKKICQWRDPKTGKGLTFNERASEILDHTIAGQDPVPAALEFTLKQLSIHLDIQFCVRSELLKSMPLAVGNNGLAIIDNLTYLNAVVMESLRLLDNIPSYQTRVVPRGGCLVLGSFLPAGVSHCSFAVHSSYDGNADMPT